MRSIDRRSGKQFERPREFHSAILHHEQPGGEEPGMIAFAVEDLKTFGIPSLGAYEGGQHLLKNAMAWSQNPKIYDEYMFMLDRYSQHFTLSRTGSLPIAEHANHLQYLA